MRVLGRRALKTDMEEKEKDHLFFLGRKKMGIFPIKGINQYAV